MQVGEAQWAGPEDRKSKKEKSLLGLGSLQGDAGQWKPVMGFRQEVSSREDNQCINTTQQQGCREAEQ